MQMVLVMRQLSGLLDAYLLRVTRRVRLTPQEALVLAWMEERPGISAAAIAECLGRYRQSVQRSLEGLEDRMLVERYASNLRDCTVGWGLTEEGRALFAELESSFRAQDQELLNRGVRLGDWVNGLHELLLATRKQSTLSPVGLVVPPPEENDPPEWDL